MVSQLSARLLASSSCGSASSISSGSDGASKTRAKQIKIAIGKPIRLPPYAKRIPALAMSEGGSSGYCADAEQRISPLPASIALLSRQGKRELQAFGTCPNESSSKRLKPSKAELNYIASTAKEAMVKGGIVFPKLNSVDPSLPSRKGVSHFQSTDQKSPFYATGTTSASPSAHNTMSLLYQLTDIVRDSASFYCTNNQPLPPVYSEMLGKIIEASDQDLEDEKVAEKEGSDSDSTTSSFTDSDQSPETVGDYNSDGEDPNSNTEHAPSVVSIGDALSISDKPRIIALRSEPFRIVQVNAAFHRLTGLPSADFLGKPINDVVWGKTLVSAMKKASDQIKVVSVDTAFKNCKQTKHTITVSPVGPGPDMLTHFAIELLHCSDTVVECRESPNGRSVPMNVMG